MKQIEITNTGTNSLGDMGLVKLSQMRKYNYLWMVVFAAFLLTTVGCKKYEFRVPDGYAPNTLTQSITIDTSSSAVDSGMFSYAKLFPGLISASEPRLQNASVTLNLNFTKQIKNLLLTNVSPGQIFSTGMYAAPGELITITVPAGIANLTCQIGIWKTHVNNGMRQPQIYSKQQLYPGVNKIRNLFGGNIYIEPVFPIAQPVTLTFGNVCKSPDIKLGDDANAWKQQLLSSSVPWFEMHAGKIIFTLPTVRMKAFLQKHPATDMGAIVNEWNNIIQIDINQWQGISDTALDLTDKAPETAWRVSMDAIPVYSSAGYPILATDNDKWLNNIMAVTDINQPEALWDILFNLGYNNQQNFWTWTTLSQVTNNLFSFKRAKRIGIQNTSDLNLKFDSTHASALAFAAKPPFDFATGTKKDFDIDAIMNNPFKRIIPFLQIFDKLKSADGTKDGFDFIPYLYKKARHAKQKFLLNDFAEHNFMYISLCEYTGIDCAFFFQAWGITISTQATDSMTKTFPVKLTKDIWKYNPFTKMGGDSTVTSLGLAFDRSNWTITSDGQETAGEDGKLLNVIDGKNNTFWSSPWSQSSPPYPHFIRIDLKKEMTVSGITFLFRQGKDWGTTPKDVEIYVGTSDATLTKVASASLAYVKTTQVVDLPVAAVGSLIRVVFLNAQPAHIDADGSISNPTNNCTLAEINAF